MRRRFWNFIHDRLEDAWHWVYYHKLTEPVTLPPVGNVRYTFVYGQAAVVTTDLAPVRITDDTVKTDARQP